MKHIQLEGLVYCNALWDFWRKLLFNISELHAFLFQTAAVFELANGVGWPNNFTADVVFQSGCYSSRFRHRINDISEFSQCFISTIVVVIGVNDRLS